MRLHYDLSGLEEQIAKDLGIHAASQIVDVLERTFSLAENPQMRAKIGVYALDGLSICIGAVIANHAGTSYSEYAKDPHWWSIEALHLIRDCHQAKMKKQGK